ncbi:methionine synthase [Nocardioides sp. GXQ0305]|uniref:methionine synthase n=1 Tax=Nocardioides sp. GXQ0305 TaxID=3423912 RepID=UPI003D7CD481
MTLATGIGSHPGDDAAAYVEAVKVVLGELAGHLPYVPELPGRGATATMTGRAVAVATDLAFDLQPAGWRLTDAEGVDQRRARSLLAQDLDQVEEQAQGYEGAFKAQLTGPWTLAATTERPRGDRVLADHGARRELAQALAEGVRRHLADLRRRLPGVDRWVVQVDEPALPGVLAGAIPTASGFGKHRVVQPPEASAALGWVLEAVAEAGAEPWVHCCAADAPLGLVRGAGARGLAVDLTLVGAEGHEVLAGTLEAGETVVLGVVPTSDDASEAAVTEAASRWLEMVGLEPGDGLVLSPSCGLAGASPATARRVLELARAAASHL